jgi:TetR/AcrR family fatty acid metabolism transcriptional regulator
MAIKQKKIEILNAAEEILFQKRLKNTNISDIARLAQVPDSAIYQYFKGKEDLLFTIAGERLKEATSLLLEHLEGIEDPVSRLRKMIWFNLNYNDTHKQYAHLLLMECRYSKGFYEHEAYTFIRRYAGILLSILKAGVNKNVFCCDIDMRLARDAIFGLLDLEKLNCYAYKEIAATLPDFDDIMSLILPMIAAQPDKMETDKSSRILDAAKKVFSKLGYDQATISEIAQLAGVAKGTVYEYFKNKEDLLLAIPQKHYLNYIEKSSELVTIKLPLRKLRRFIRYHFLLHLTDRDFLKVFLVHILYNQLFYDSPVYETFLRYMDILNDILAEGKKDGTIRSDVNNRVFRNLFLGAFSHISLRWFILKEESKVDKMEELDEVVSLLCRAVASNS